MEQSKTIQLRLDIQDNYLMVELANISSNEILLWQPNSFLGWESIRFHIKTNSSNVVSLIKRKIRDWTGVGLPFLKLLPGETYSLKINLKDGWWDIDEAINNLNKGPILIQAVFDSTPSSEAKENGVFVGTVFSDWVLSEPPHQWLFSDHQLQMKVVVKSNMLSINISNISADEICIWDFNNSWGWSTISFKLKTHDAEYRIEHVDTVFHHRPSCVKIRAHETKQFVFNLKDGQWKVDDKIMKLRNVPVQINVNINVPVFPETEEFGAFFGSVQSDWVVSNPPHDWL